MFRLKSQFSREMRLFSVSRNLRKCFSTSELTTAEALNLSHIGISSPAPVFRNLSYTDIAEHEKKCKPSDFIICVR